MAYTINYDTNPQQDDIKILIDGLSSYAKLKRNQPKTEAFAFFIRDNTNKIRGGCSGFIYYGCLYIDLLWLDEPLRGNKLGTQLMHAVERLSKDRNAHFITVTTMDWEALGFYKKFGFHVEFERNGYLHNSILYFLRKSLI